MSQVIQYINAPTLIPPRGHYSHCVNSNGFVFISGQLPIDSTGQAKTKDPFKTQTELVLQNIDACLSAANITKANLVQVRVYIADMNDWQEFNQIYAAWIGDFRPARAVAGVAELHFNAALEIEATAVLG
ncbi:RidA family protein [Providencia rettgeri]|uniref:RidA family protein n=1 Tax=Providencia rettgeri TaxID=587 RepID=UPI0034E061B9